MKAKPSLDFAEVTKFVPDDIITVQTTIFGRIAYAMKLIKPIAKDRENPQQKYKFRGIDDLYSSLQPIFAEAGIFSVPTVLESHTDERPSKSGGTLFRTTMKVKYTFYAVDGTYVECVTQGEAMDSGDKGSNKAMSAAQKYALLQIFAIPTDEPKDTEHESPEPEYRANTISESQVKRLFAIARTAGRTDEDIKSVLSHYGYTSSKDIGRSDYDLIVAALEPRK